MGKIDNIIQVHSVSIEGDGISGLIKTQEGIHVQNNIPNYTVLELFAEKGRPKVKELAIADYYGMNPISMINRFMKLGNKQKYLSFYLNAIKRYRKGEARNLIETADIRVWHFGGYYPLFDNIRRRDFVYFHNITYPYLSENTESLVRSRMRLAALRDLDLKFITHSQFNKDTLMKMGFPEEHIAILNLYTREGVEWKYRFHSEPRLLAYGRYAINKAIPELASFCNESNIPLTVFGDNAVDKEYRQEYKKAMKFANKDIKLLPKQSSPINHLKDANIYICNSYHEGWNSGLTEALTYGLPVLARRGTGMDEVFTDGLEGYHYDNLSEIPEMIDEIMKNYKEFSQSAYKKSKEYSLTHYSERYLKILGELQ